MSRLFTGNASNYLSPANNAAYQLTSPTISVAAWIKLTSTGAHQIFIGQNSTSWFFRVSAGDKLDAETSAVSKLGLTSLTTATWYHVAFTSDGSGNWVWYLNGVSDNSGSGLTWSGPDTTLNVGQDVGSNPFDGRIAYLALWNTALTSGNITTLQTSTTPESVGSGCVASWHMNTSSLADSSATNNILVVTGTVAFDADNPSIGGGAGPSSFSKPLWPMSYF